MKLSIIVTNWNRAWYLDRSIPIMAQQTFPASDFEYILVDDGSVDESHKVIMRHEKEGTLKQFKYLKRTVPRKKSGNPALARNIGAKASEGGCLIFTDPEVLPVPDWAQKHYLAHFGDLYSPTAVPGRINGGSRLINPTDDIPDVANILTNRHVIGLTLCLRFLHAIDPYWKGALVSDIPNTLEWTNGGVMWNALADRIEKLPVPAAKLISEFYFYMMTQAGLSVSRHMLYALRGFEEDFSNPALGLDKWSGEDTWFGHCAQRYGGCRVEEHSARAIHLPHTNETYGCVACGVANDKAKQNPEQYESNIDREWGLLKENGFERVF